MDNVNYTLLRISWFGFHRRHLVKNAEYPIRLVPHNHLISVKFLLKIMTVGYDEECPAVHRGLTLHKGLKIRKLARPDGDIFQDAP